MLAIYARQVSKSKFRKQFAATRVPRQQRHAARNEISNICIFRENMAGFHQIDYFHQICQFEVFS